MTFDSNILLSGIHGLESLHSVALWWPGLPHCELRVRKNRQNHLPDHDKLCRKGSLPVSAASKGVIS